MCDLLHSAVYFGDDSNNTSIHQLELKCRPLHDLVWPLTTCCILVDVLLQVRAGGADWFAVDRRPRSQVLPGRRRWNRIPCVAWRYSVQCARAI